jgi:hypothetical protein
MVLASRQFSRISDPAWPTAGLLFALCFVGAGDATSHKRTSPALGAALLTTLIETAAARPSICFLGLHSFQNTPRCYAGKPLWRDCSAGAQASNVSRSEVVCAYLRSSEW